MADIYNTNAWAATTSYLINDVVLQNNLYYYALENHVSSAAFVSDLSKWGGIISVNGQSKPHFLWVPSYGYNLDIEPRVKSIKMGDGYEQIVSEGINNILLPINLEFNDRGLSEYSAILHFLHTRAGYDEFYFTPAAPFNIQKKFTCPRWNPTQISYDKYNIRVEFKEKV